MPLFTVYIDQKQTEELDDTYPNSPTPFLPMSPGGLDEIMAQSPATLDFLGDVLETEELTNITYTKSNDKNNSFTIQTPLISSKNRQTSSPQASTSKQNSSLFKTNISQIPQQIEIQPPHSFILPSDMIDLQQDEWRTRDQNIK